MALARSEGKGHDLGTHGGRPRRVSTSPRAIALSDDFGRLRASLRSCLRRLRLVAGASLATFRRLQASLRSCLCRLRLVAGASLAAFRPAPGVASLLPPPTAARRWRFPRDDFGRLRASLRSCLRSCGSSLALPSPRLDRLGSGRRCARCLRRLRLVAGASLAAAIRGLSPLGSCGSNVRVSVDTAAIPCPTVRAPSSSDRPRSASPRGRRFIDHVWT